MSSLFFRNKGWLILVHQLLICSVQMSSNMYLHSTLYQESINVFPEIKLHGLVPNSYIHVSVRYLYIPRIGLPIWLQQNRQPDPGNI
jgi:hypothetical protein